jgi:hypothetical protein
MINFKHGTAYSLDQSQAIGTLPSPKQGIISGQVVYKDNNGQINQGYPSTGVVGQIAIALNSDAEGEVLASNVLGCLNPDGNSEIETDQAISISSANYPVGTALTGVPVSAGSNVGLWTLASNYSSQRVLGYVTGVRTLPNVLQTINGVSVQGTATVVGIKLTI